MAEDNTQNFILNPENQSVEAEDLIQVPEIPVQVAEMPIPAEQVDIESPEDQDLKRQQEIIDRAKRGLAAETRSGILTSEPDPEKVIDKVLEQKQASEKLKQSEERDKNQEAEKIVQSYMDLKDKYIQAGLNPPQPPEEFHEAMKFLSFNKGAQPLLTEMINPEDLQIEAELQPHAPADRQDIKQAEAEATEVSKEEVLNQAQNIKEQNTELQAQELAAQSQIQEAQERLEKAQANLDEEDLKLQKIEPDRFWNSKTTGQKILAGIGLILGGAGAGLTGGPNLALQQLDKAIENDIKSQQLNNKQILARRKAAYDKVNQEISRLSNLTNDNIKLQRLQLAKDQIDLKKQEIDQKRLQLAQEKQLQALVVDRIKSGTLQDPTLLKKEDRERVVRVSDGSIRLADNKEAAKQVTKFQQDVIPAIQGAKRLLNIAESGSRFNLEDRARVATELKALVGQLRIPFTGPGILTDTEYERLLNTIGDPNKLFALPSLEKLKVKTVISKLSKDLNERYRQAGIQAPVSKREKWIQKKLEQNVGSREQIEKSIDSLVEKGVLPQEYGQGF